MKNFRFLSISSYRYSILGNLRHFPNDPESVVIVSAARTPWGKCQGQLSSLSAGQLGQFAVDAAVKQSAIPLEQIAQIFMNETLKFQRKSLQNEYIFSNFLNKTKYLPITVGHCGESRLVSLAKAVEFLKCRPQAAMVLGGFDSATQSGLLKNKELESPNNHFNDVCSEFIQNYVAESSIRYTNSQNDAVFNSELVPLTVQQGNGNRRIIREVMQDEILNEKNRKDYMSLKCSDGAAALVLTTLANAQELKLSPLAIIIDFVYCHSSSNIRDRSAECVEKLLSKLKLDPGQIQHWEIEDYIPELIDFLKNRFKLNLDLINPHGGSAILGYSPAASLTRLSTHLTHTLSPFDYGCTICSSSQESLALIIKKLPFPSTPKSLPLLTVYTKDPCPLCDMFVSELESYFPGEYDLEKVFIDTKENLRFLRLYRNDIPVAFLNNQFLCMHRLNQKLLRKRLNILSKK